MNYISIEAMARSGIAFFGDAENEIYRVRRTAGGIDDNGHEIPASTVKDKISGVFRSPRSHEVDGDAVRANDVLGIFNNDLPIENGDKIEVNGVMHIVVNNRPVQSARNPVAYRPVMRRVAVNG